MSGSPFPSFTENFPPPTRVCTDLLACGRTLTSWLNFRVSIGSNRDGSTNTYLQDFLNKISISFLAYFERIMQVHSAVGINLKRTFLKKDFKKMKFGHVATRISHWTAISIRVNSTMEMYYVAVYSHDHSGTITNVLSGNRWWSSDWWNIHINSHFSEWSKICLMSNLVEIQIQGMKTMIWVKFPFSCRRHCLKNHHLANLAGFNEIYKR